MSCRRLLKPLDYHTAQMADAVKAAARGFSRCLDCGRQMCHLRSPVLLLFTGNDNQFGGHVGFHECSQRVFTEDSPTGQHGVVQFNENGSHEPKHRIFVGKDTNHFGTPLQFLVQTFDVVGCAVITSQTNREKHDGHGTLKPVIQA